MYWLPIFLMTAAVSVQAQQTAQTRIADILTECYRDPGLLNKNNLPPATIQVLIDIIRQIEDNPNVNMDLRQLSSVLLHTYRQDGIEYHAPETAAAAANVIPFAATYYPFYRFSLLMSKLIPNNLQVLGNDTIPSPLKCALHHMISTTVDRRVRGDENSCNQLSQYRAMRTARSGRSVNDDVEILDPSLVESANKNGKLRRYNPNADVEYSSYGGLMSEKQIAESTCPLLDGVVHTVWGAVSAGNVIAGIAAGAQPQQVNINDLVRDGSNSAVNYNTQTTVNSIYPATLTGDLAEAALIQGTERGRTTITIGTAGNWNSTQSPRYFMLHNRQDFEMSDPEIRGDIDGFVLGSAISSLLSTYSSMKLSQLLDMYYSPVNGAMEPSFRACNRRGLEQQYVNSQTLMTETNAFAAALDTYMPLRGTITGGLDQLTTSAVNNLQSYTTSNMNDMNCVTTLTTNTDYRLKTNLFIVLDSSWQYQAVYPAISYLLDSIEVGKYGSSVTLLNAFDGSIVINTTYSLATFHTMYNASRHQSLMSGVNLESSLTNIRAMMQNRLQIESGLNYIGGNSTVLLYLVNSGNLQNNENVWRQAELLNNTVPDLRLLFATSSNQYDNLWNLVRDVHNDIHTISLNTAGTNLDVVLAPLLRRIQSVGRRIVNPLCGSQWVDASSGTRQFDDYVEPGYINFYTVSANYFYQNNDNRKVRIARSGAGAGSLIICYSRTVVQPRQNSTTTGEEENAVVCHQLATTGNVEISLQNFCSDYWTINTCPPLYISVQSSTALTAGSFSSAVCSEPACRFPYNIRYQVQIEEFGCYSSANAVAAGFALLLTVLYFVLL